MKHFTATDDLNNLLGEKDLSLLYFSASWCGPCKAMSPVMEQIAESFVEDIATIKIDVDKAPEAARKYGLRGVPALVLLNKGKVVDTMVGAQPPQYVSQWLTDNL